MAQCRNLGCMLARAKPSARALCFTLPLSLNCPYFSIACTSTRAHCAELNRVQSSERWWLGFAGFPSALLAGKLKPGAWYEVGSTQVCYMHAILGVDIPQCSSETRFRTKHVKVSMTSRALALFGCLSQRLCGSQMSEELWRCFVLPEARCLLAEVRRQHPEFLWQRTSHLRSYPSRHVFAQHNGSQVSTLFALTLHIGCTRSSDRCCRWRTRDRVV